MFGSKQGYTLPLTITILLVIGYLSFSFYEMVKRERQDSFRRYKNIQAELELESAANYSFYRMAQEGKPWRTDSLTYSTKDGTIGFFIRHFQDGAFARLEAHNRDSSKSLSVHTGFIPKARPALVLTAPQSSIALVGDARIEGGTATKKGSVSYSTNYKMRATKEAFHDTVYVGDTLPYFDILKYYPELSRKNFADKFSQQNCVFDGVDLVPEELSCATVVLQGDSRCKGCKIQAERVFIRERSKIEHGDITARTISAKENVSLNGVFFAQDSLEINVNTEQNAKNTFVLQGRKVSDVDYTGKMAFKKLKAKDASIIFLGDNWDETLRGVPVEITEEVDITGAIIVNGTIDFRGKLKGHMTISNFSFYEGETLWRGFLRGGQIKGDTSVHVMLPDMVYFGGDPSYE